MKLMNILAGCAVLAGAQAAKSSTSATLRLVTNGCSLDFATTRLSFPSYAVVF